MEMTLKLDEKEVKEIVKEWAIKQGYTVKEVTVNTGTEDNERGGGSWTVLRNVEVKVTKSV